MPFYLRAGGINPDRPAILDIWEIDRMEAKCLSADRPPIVAAPGEDALTVLRTQLFPGMSTFHKLELEPGEYYPGMARPIADPLARELDHVGQNPNADAHRRASTTGQLHALIQQLEHICRVVQPIDRNFLAYGHEIRNVLILACTEVESQWKAILAANGASANRTADYVKLATPMKLAEYSVDLPYYP